MQLRSILIIIIILILCTSNPSALDTIAFSFNALAFKLKIFRRCLRKVQMGLFVCLQQRIVPFFDWNHIHSNIFGSSKYVILKVFLKIILDHANMWYWKGHFKKVSQNLYLLLLTSLSFKPSLACDNSYYVNTHTQVFIENKYIPMPDLTQSIWYLIDPRLFR